MSGETWNYVLATIWLVSATWCLIRLRGFALPPTARAVWALAILLIPFLGAAAFLIVVRSRRGGSPPAF
jgi:hypothetical protein